MQGKVVVMQVSAELHKKIKMLCAENEITIHDLFVDALNSTYYTGIRAEDDTRFKLEEGHERRKSELEERTEVKQ
jgi:hypothetical protein